MFKTTKSKIIAVVVVVLLVAVLLVVLMGGADEPAAGQSAIVATKSSQNPASVNADAQELLRILQSLNNVELDHTFLTSKAFLNLMDFGATLPASIAGRRYPFDVVKPNEPPYIQRGDTPTVDTEPIDIFNDEYLDSLPEFRTEASTTTQSENPFAPNKGASTTSKPKP